LTWASVPYAYRAQIPEENTASSRRDSRRGWVCLVIHIRETYYVLSGELEVIVGDEIFILREGDTLIAPRDIPHQLRNSGNTENHYLLMFSPSGFEGFLKETAIPAPANAVAPTKPPAVAVRNVHKLADDYGILFG
jgi:Cupin domain